MFPAKKFRFSILAVTAILALGVHGVQSAAFAQPRMIQQNNQFSCEQIGIFRSSSGRLFTSNLIYGYLISDNLGEEWTNISRSVPIFSFTQPPSGRIYALARFDSLYPRFMYRIVYSIDDGISWSNLESLGDSLTLTPLYCKEDSVLLVGSYNHGFRQNYVMKYNFSMHRWDTVLDSISNTRQFISTANNTYFAITENEIFRSTTGGNTWIPLNFPTSTYIDTHPFLAVIRDTVFLTYNFSVYYSIDCGNNWCRIGDSYRSNNPFVGQTGFAISNSMDIYVSFNYGYWDSIGVIKLPFGTTSWQTIFTSDAKTLTLVNDSTLFVCGSGTFRSSDCGMSWVELVNAFSEDDIVDFSVTNPNLHVAIGNGAIYYSTNQD